MKLVFEQITDWEMKLHDAGVFTNGFTGRKCSAASYGTIFSWKAFDAVWHENEFTRDQWKDIAGYYRRQWCLSPIFGLLAATIARKLGLPSPLEKTEKTESFYS